MNILYGTGNQAKLNAMRKHLTNLPINILGLKDIKSKLPVIDENGNNPLENARIKASQYYKTLNKPVFSCDSGLYIKNAPDELQPGVHVRNVNGKYLNDDEMISHYTQLSEHMGGNITVQYKNAICLIINENEIFEYMGDDIAGEEFILTSNPHPKRTKGFPLDSLSIHIKTGKYYHDLDKLKDRSSMDKGFQNFFKQSLNL